MNNTYAPKRGEPAHQTLSRAAAGNRPFRIALPCGRVTRPIDPAVAKRLSKIAAVLDLA